MALFPMYFVFFLPFIANEIISLIFKNKEKILFGKFEFKNHKVLKKLFLIMLGGVVAGLINPSGLTPFTYTFKTMLGVSTKYINEHAPMEWVILKFNIEYIIAYCMAIIVVLFPKVKIKLSDLFLILGLIIMSIMSIRQIALYVVITSIFFAKYLNQIFEYILNLKVFKGDDFKILKIVGTILILVMIFEITAVFYRKYNFKKEYIDSDSYPVESAEWIKENLDLENLRLYNNYTDGSYLVLAKVPNFIDTRCDLFTAEFNESLEKNNDIFLDCMKVERDTSKYKKVFEKYDINACLVNKSYAEIKELENDESFESVYEDKNYIVYIKK